MKKIFNPSTGAYKGLGGFISIGSIFPSEFSWLSFWNITAFLSIMLGFMNLLPIPALDGGHVVFTLWEMITGKKPGDKFLEYAQLTGFIILIVLLLFANGNDIIRKLSHHADTIYFTTHVFLNPNSTNPKVREFIKLYRAKFHTTPHNAFSALAYDTANLIAYTLNKANGFSAKDFIKALATVHNFVGVTGKISYAGGRHIPLKTVSIVRIHNNKATLAARLVPAFVPQPIR